MGIQPSSSKRSQKAPALTPSPGAKSLSRACSIMAFAPALHVVPSGGMGRPPLRRSFGELHEFDLVAVGIPRPRLPIAVAADGRFAVYGRAVLPQVLDGRVQIIGQQADVHKALRPVQIGRRSAGEDLDKAVARDVQVHEHQGAVIFVQPERLLDAEHIVEADGLIYVVRREGGVSEVGDHTSGSFRCSSLAMSSAKRTSESSTGSYPITFLALVMLQNFLALPETP